MPKNLNCWGCGDTKRFATISAMIVHLESGTCAANWTIQHLNALAAESSHSKDFLVKGGRTPWLLAGAPPRFVKAADFDPHRRGGGWFCPTCDRRENRRSGLHEHLQSQACGREYPEVFECPVCPDRFTTLSGMFQHVETTRCPASRETRGVRHLLNMLVMSLADGVMVQEQYIYFSYHRFSFVWWVLLGKPRFDWFLSLFITLRQY